MCHVNKKNGRSGTSPLRVLFKEKALSFRRPRPHNASLLILKEPANLASFPYLSLLSEVSVALPDGTEVV